MHQNRVLKASRPWLTDFIGEQSNEEKKPKSPSFFLSLFNRYQPKKKRTFEQKKKKYEDDDDEWSVLSDMQFALYASKFIDRNHSFMRTFSTK